MTILLSNFVIKVWTKGTFRKLSNTTVETNLNVISMQRSVWQCLAVQDNFNILNYDIMKETDCHVPALVYKGQTLKEAEENEPGTGDGEDYQTNDNDTIDAATKQIEM